MNKDGKASEINNLCMTMQSSEIKFKTPEKNTSVLCSICKTSVLLVKVIIRLRKIEYLIRAKFVKIFNKKR